MKREMPYLTLKPHILKWWDIANDRRIRLILQKHQGKGLTPQQEFEYKLLQTIAGHVADACSPPFKKFTE